MTLEPNGIDRRPHIVLRIIQAEVGAAIIVINADFLGIPKGEIANHTRADLVNRLLDEERHQILSRLAEKNRLEVFTFSDDLRRRTASAAARNAAGGAAEEETPMGTEGEPSPSINPAASTNGAVPTIDLEPRGASTNLSSERRRHLRRSADRRRRAHGRDVVPARAKDSGPHDRRR